MDYKQINNILIKKKLKNNLKDIQVMRATTVPPNHK